MLDEGQDLPFTSCPVANLINRLVDEIEAEAASRRILQLVLWVRGLRVQRDVQSQ